MYLNPNALLGILILAGLVLVISFFLRKWVLEARKLSMQFKPARYFSIAIKYTFIVFIVLALPSSFFTALSESSVNFFRSSDFGLGFYLELLVMSFGIGLNIAVFKTGGVSKPLP